MAIATCCAIAFILSAHLAALSLLVFLLGPFILIARHVSMGSKGPFELDYRMFLFEQRMNRLLKAALGRRRYSRLFKFRLVWGTMERRQQFVEILEDQVVKTLSDLRFHLYVKIGDLLTKEAKIEQATSWLEKALEIDNQNCIVNYKAAEVSEYLGNKDEAIGYYRAAMRDRRNCQKLDEFFLAQIDRMNLKGLRNRPRDEGHRFIIR